MIDCPMVYLLEEWHGEEWRTVPSGFTLYTIGQAMSYAEQHCRQWPGIYRIAVYQRTMQVTLDTLHATH
jgi:hypothetical protein